MVLIIKECSFICIFSFVIFEYIWFSFDRNDVYMFVIVCLFMGFFFLVFDLFVIFFFGKCMSKIELCGINKF